MKSFLPLFALLTSCVTALYANTGAITDTDTTPLRGEGPKPAPTPTQRLSNAERLRLNLPLLPPKRRSTSALLSPRASCVPNALTGKIQVRSTSSGGIQGYIVDWSLSSLNFLGPESDLLVQLTLPTNGEAVEIIPLNDSGASSAFPFFGLIGGSTPLGPGSTASAGFGGVNHSPPNSPPSSQGSESTIWLVDPTNLSMTVQWTNADGSQNPVTIAYDIRVNQLFLVGDLAAYNEVFYWQPASAVTFHFEPSSVPGGGC